MTSTEQHSKQLQAISSSPDKQSPITGIGMATILGTSFRGTEHMFRECVGK
jgi:hypothetical protein